ncbi:BlaI/MecI/CopY family transcriptional regulator [Sphingobacterium sp. SYP-B4668]|uniref:BlaI/MecI/CopY family transcriptional regulator n=1 Tax=Sphingobacterium sp. SYP-B4668 TaxID=2996035 RepID=UPI0022DE3EF4|nr:BlaI/MecI/CopY family transcriptional regulator [Sphingobacterium sp. SYP-B4668]
MSLSKTEEQLMEILWKHNNAFTKEIMESYDDPIPANSTVLTLLKRMQDKGYVGYRMYGNSRRYYPLVDKKEYFEKHVNNLIKDFFDGSPLQFASFFTKSTNLSQDELLELKEIIDNEVLKKIK